MSFPHDSRPAVRGKARTSSQAVAASDQGMSGWGIRRQVPRILVVDDNPGIAALMSQLLAMRGYEVVTAADAQQAEVEVRRQAPDLILSDVKMPGKSGYELCRELKGDPATRLIPFVLITGLVDSAEKLRGISGGGRLSEQAGAGGRADGAGEVAAASERIHRRAGNGGFCAVHSGSDRRRA
jgi:CheY-like chemotaxis protein